MVALGYGLHVAWVSCLFYQGALFDAVGNSSAHFPFYLASMGVLSCTLLAFAFLGKQGGLTDTLTKRPMAITFAVLTAVGSVVACAVRPGEGFFAAALVVSAVLTGAGSAYINVAWGCRLVRFRRMNIAVALCFAYALGSLCYYLITHMPTAVFVAVAGVLPLATVTLVIACGTAPMDEAPCEVRSQYVMCDLQSFARRLLGAALAFGVVQGSIQGLTFALGMTSATIGHSTMVVLCMAVPLLAAAAYIASLRFRSSPIERFVDIYRVALLVMIGALLVSSVYGMPHTVLQVVMLVGYTFFKIVVWSELGQIGRAGTMSPIYLFGAGEAFMTMALMLGNAALYALSWDINVAVDGVRIAIALCIALLLVSYLFLFTERNIIAVDDIIKLGSDDAPRRRFQARVDELSKRCGLTKRESEVLAMFVRGRSTARIAEDLYISSGTVATHLRNVYHKVGVHSRQELLDVIEEKPA